MLLVVSFIAGTVFGVSLLLLYQMWSRSAARKAPIVRLDNAKVIEFASLRKALK